MESSIMQVVKWAEGKMIGAKVEADRKEMNIYHDDVVIRGEFETAAKFLNRCGCLAFKRSIQIFKKFENSLCLGPAGVVSQTYKKGDKEVVKTYQTDEVRCDCSFWKKNQHVWRHILFVRQTKHLPLFSKELFLAFYLRKENIAPELFSQRSDFSEESLRIFCR